MPITRIIACGKFRRIYQQHTGRGTPVLRVNSGREITSALTKPYKPEGNALELLETMRIGDLSDPPKESSGQGSQKASVAVGRCPKP